MELFESLSFTYALVISAVLAFILSIGPGVLFLRRRKRKRAPAMVNEALVTSAAVVNSYMAAELKEESEIDRFAAGLGATIDRLEESVLGCLDRCDRLIAVRTASKAAGKVKRPRRTGSDLPEKVISLRENGVDEAGIAGRLNLDSELVKLYMHVGLAGR